jgi:hypothetical protein
MVKFVFMPEENCNSPLTIALQKHVCLGEATMSETHFFSLLNHLLKCYSALCLCQSNVPWARKHTSFLP